ncbi:MAG TPA: SUF system NifU family Fe-S cluster assembly protein [Steroidobacteraceae bacterium]|nr:SUF system NifU family Fe-S cluster assembly protein [Steroidobacteraceae bacterium]
MDLKDLYRDVILDHNRHPRNVGRPAQPALSARGHNPLCGDELTVYAVLDGDVVRELRFEGSGCAISVASASLMTEALTGKTVPQANRLFGLVHDLLTRADAPSPPELGKLAALSGVRGFPARVKCASLCWHTLQAALAHASDPVTTE